ncbi:hypothetical protein HOF92_10880 [bacterium]|jgi:type II secretory pathway component PulF|nr:hypothetical protein [bacterium]
MLKNQEAAKVALLINVVLVTFQYMAVVWILGPFSSQFKSIFESMNVELPTMTTFILSVSGAVDGPLGLGLVLLIVLAGIGAGWLVMTTQQIYVVLPITNALQSLALLIGFVVFIWIFVPMLTLVNGVG